MFNGVCNPDRPGDDEWPLLAPAQGAGKFQTRNAIGSRTEEPSSDTSNLRLRRASSIKRTSRLGPAMTDPAPLTAMVLDHAG